MRRKDLKTILTQYLIKFNKKVLLKLGRDALIPEKQIKKMIEKGMDLVKLNVKNENMRDFISTINSTELELWNIKTNIKNY